ncbi:MAG TPA: hypothetical protein VFJ67_03755 [Thermodesulfobacteriota bacterium]|nr:hypothetical protein [Thermodesulfobacteriota bacterium]
MGGTYLEGEKALERLGDLAELICRIAEGSGLENEDEELLEGLLLEMGAALRERDLPGAKKIVARMLSEVLGYDEVRAGFVMRNHLNKNAGWG